MTKARITETHREGKGDTGFSLLLNDELISKGTAACNLYSRIEWLQYNLSLLPAPNEVSTRLEKEVMFFSKWLNNTLFSLSAFCWLKASPEEDKRELYIYGENLYNYLVEATENFKKTGTRTDFIQVSNLRHFTVLKLLAETRLRVRDVESAYVAWWESPLMIREERINPSVEVGIRQNAKVLNRLSSYYYWAFRAIVVELAENLANIPGLHPEFTEWKLVNLDLKKNENGEYEPG